MNTKGKNDSTGERAAVELSGKISEVVLYIAKMKGVSRGKLADQMGYSRSAFSQMLNSTDTSRMWRLTTLCAVAGALGMPLSTLVHMAEQWNGESIDDTTLIALYTAGSEPQSSDRLERIISATAKQGMAIVSEKECSLRVLSIGCKSFVDDYLSGKLGDCEAYKLMVKAKNGADDLPFWAVLSEEYAKSNN